MVSWTVTIWIQWGSEYRTRLVFKWSKVVRSLNGPLFECHLYTGLNFVQYSNCCLKTKLPFEYRTSEYWQVKVRYSDVSVIQMFPLLFRCLLFRSQLYQTLENRTFGQVQFSNGQKKREMASDSDAISFFALKTRLKTSRRLWKLNHLAPLRSKTYYVQFSGPQCKLMKNSMTQYIFSTEYSHCTRLWGILNQC